METKTTNATTKTPVNNSKSLLDALANQEVKTFVDYSGIYLTGAVEPWEMNGNSGESGFVQLLQYVGEDTKRMKVKSIKVKEENFGIIELLNQSKSFQPVQLFCEIIEYGKRVDTFLNANQPSLKLESK